MCCFSGQLEKSVLSKLFQNSTFVDEKLCLLKFFTNFDLIFRVLINWHLFYKFRINLINQKLGYSPKFTLNLIFQNHLPSPFFVFSNELMRLQSLSLLFSISITDACFSAALSLGTEPFLFSERFANARSSTGVTGCRVGVCFAWMLDVRTPDLW